MKKHLFIITLQQAEITMAFLSLQYLEATFIQSHDTFKDSKSNTYIRGFFHYKKYIYMYSKIKKKTSNHLKVPSLVPV